MKTSNKLLIAFAAALIIVPILSMVVVSKAYYVDGQTWSDLVKQNDSFDGKSQNMEAISLANFKSVNIPDGKYISFNIRVIKSDKFGVKIYNRDKKLVKFNVDQEQRLIIDPLEVLAEKTHINLYVYSPNITKVAIKNAYTVDVDAVADTLLLHLDNIKYLSFDRATNCKKLSIEANKANNINVDRSIAKSLVLNLTSSNYISERVSYQDLSINISGKTGVYIKGGRDNEKKFFVNNLALQANDEATINFDNVKVEKATGSISDQTIIKMPAINLKQLLKQ